MHHGDGVRRLGRGYRPRLPRPSDLERGDQGGGARRRRQGDSHLNVPGGSMPMSLTFYYGSGSPFAWRVWLALEHKQIPYELKLLSFDRGDTRTPDYLAINPRGRVPAIVHDGFKLWESLAILEYLEESFPEKPLLARDAKTRATTRRLMTEADGDLQAALRPLYEATLFAREPVAPAALAEIQGMVLEQVQRLEADLAGDYFTGTLSLADFAL